jgi:hypothetical protein
VYKKSPKASHTTNRSGEEKTQSTIVVQGENSPPFSGIQQMMSTSSSKNHTDTSLTTQPSQESAKLSIFEKYDLIKKKNEMLTSHTYAQLWKQASTSQHRLLSTFDIEKGRMHMAFL